MHETPKLPLPEQTQPQFVEVRREYITAFEAAHPDTPEREAAQEKLREIGAAVLQPEEVRDSSEVWGIVTHEDEEGSEVGEKYVKLDGENAGDTLSDANRQAMELPRPQDKLAEIRTHNDESEKEPQSNATSEIIRSEFNDIDRQLQAIGTSSGNLLTQNRKISEAITLANRSAARLRDMAPDKAAMQQGEWRAQIRTITQAVEEYRRVAVRDEESTSVAQTASNAIQAKEEVVAKYAQPRGKVELHERILDVAVHVKTITDAPYAKSNRVEEALAQLESDITLGRSPSTIAESAEALRRGLSNLARGIEDRDSAVRTLSRSNQNLGELLRSLYRQAK